jgi:hypothetical protein
MVRFFFVVMVVYILFSATLNEYYVGQTEDFVLLNIQRSFFLRVLLRVSLIGSYSIRLTVRPARKRPPDNYRDYPADAKRQVNRQAGLKTAMKSLFL